jgi:hypothetical protein
LQKVFEPFNPRKPFVGELFIGETYLTQSFGKLTPSFFRSPAKPKIRKGSTKFAEICPIRALIGARLV